MLWASVRAWKVQPVGVALLFGLAMGAGSARGAEPVLQPVPRIFALDAAGHVIGEKDSWLSLSRVVPEELEGPVPHLRGDPSDSLRFVVAGLPHDLPERLEFRSEVNGRWMDTLGPVAIEDGPCPSALQREQGQGVGCRSTELIRLVGDVTDRRHPAVAKRSLLSEVGGSVRVTFHASGRTSSTSWLVGGPRELETAGPGRYRARLRARILRTSVGGQPSIGTDEEEARDLLRAELTSANRIWGQCGIHFGDPAELDVAVVQPPLTTLLSVGCGHGLPASGGELRLRWKGHSVRLKTSAGQTPVGIAGRIADALETRGLRVERFINPRVQDAALPSVDLRVLDAQGRPLAVLGSEKGGFSTDPSLSVCSLDLDLEDGVEHFSDGNSAAGTLEERALLRAFMDDDPSTIDLLIVPAFSGVGRIGESFIFSPGVSVQNALVIDRGGVRASTRSFTLAHELGHILLDMPGHPDDYGVDRPDSLMDADAADGTIFGPRRLSLDDCRRALRQSGPRAPVPLLHSWPLHVSRAGGGGQQVMSQR